MGYGPLENTLLDEAPSPRRRSPTPIPMGPEPAPPPPHSRASRPADASASRIPERVNWKIRTVIFLLVAPLIFALLLAGFEIRQRLWQSTAPIRFHGDVNNAYNWGTRVVSEAHILAVRERGAAPADPIAWKEFFRAYCSIYDKVQSEHPDHKYGFDYPPIRLLAVALWARHEQTIDPAATVWRDDLTTPMLVANTVAEISAAVLMFFLVRLWHDRCAATSAPAHGGWITGLVAATLVWFNAALLLDAHAWPQWDVWVLPFYLLAALAVSCDRPLLAGVSIAVGCLFKGQILLTAPLFVLWPLMEGKPLVALRVAAGWCAGVAMIASPWLINGSAAWLCVGITMVIVTTLAALLMGRKHLPFVIAIAVAGSIGAAALVWLGDFAWWRVGVAYGTRHYFFLTMGRTSNLASLLGVRYGWKPQDVVFTIDHASKVAWRGVHFDVTLRTLLICVYALTLVLSALGAAMKSRRKDPRVLIALATPWLLAFAFLPQMHERYLVWAAAMTALAAGASLGLTLLHLLMTAISTVMIAQGLFASKPDYWPTMLRFLNGTHPDIGWVVMLCAAIFLYVAIRPSRADGTK